MAAMRYIETYEARMTHSQESRVSSSQDALHLREENTSSVSSLVNEINSCLSDADVSANKESLKVEKMAATSNQEGKKQQTVYPWLSIFEGACRSAIGHKNIKKLEGLITMFLGHVTENVKECYTRPNRAAKLRKCINETLLFFHLFYQDIKEPGKHSSYLDLMTELVSMYMDMEIKAACRQKEKLKKITSRLTSALYIFLDQSEDHVLDTILKAKLINKHNKDVCLPVLGKVVNQVPSSLSEMLYVRYLLVFKIFKKIVQNTHKEKQQKAEERKRINKLAVLKLKPPANFAETAKIFTNVLPKIPPKSKKNITHFFMQARLNLESACTAFLKGTKEFEDNLGSNTDKDLFFSKQLSMSSTIDDKPEDEAGHSKSLSSNDMWAGLDLESLMQNTQLKDLANSKKDATGKKVNEKMKTKKKNIGGKDKKKDLEKIRKKKLKKNKILGACGDATSMLESKLLGSKKGKGDKKKKKKLSVKAELTSSESTDESFSLPETSALVETLQKELEALQKQPIKGYPNVAGATGASTSAEEMLSVVSTGTVQKLEMSNDEDMPEMSEVPAETSASVLSSERPTTTITTSMPAFSPVSAVCTAMPPPPLPSYTSPPPPPPPPTPPTASLEQPTTTTPPGGPPPPYFSVFSSDLLAALHQKCNTDSRSTSPAVPTSHAATSPFVSACSSSVPSPRRITSNVCAGLPAEFSPFIPPPPLPKYPPPPPPPLPPPPPSPPSTQSPHALTPVTCLPPLPSSPAPLQPPLPRSPAPPLPPLPSGSVPSPSNFSLPPMSVPPPPFFSTIRPPPTPPNALSRSISPHQSVLLPSVLSAPRPLHTQPPPRPTSVPSPHSHPSTSGCPSTSPNVPPHPPTLALPPPKLLSSHTPHTVPTTSSLISTSSYPFTSTSASSSSCTPSVSSSPPLSSNKSSVRAPLSNSACARGYSPQISSDVCSVDKEMGVNIQQNSTMNSSVHFKVPVQVKEPAVSVPTPLSSATTPIHSPVSVPVSQPDTSVSLSTTRAYGHTRQLSVSTPPPSVSTPPPSVSTPPLSVLTLPPAASTPPSVTTLPPVPVSLPSAHVRAASVHMSLPSVDVPPPLAHTHLSSPLKRPHSLYTPSHSALKRPSSVHTPPSVCTSSPSAHSQSSSVPAQQPSVHTPPPAVCTAPPLVLTWPPSVPVKPSSVPAKPSAVPAKPSEVPAKPSAVPAKPSAMPAKPSAVPAKPSAVPAKPSSVPAKPSSVSTKPSVPTKPSSVPTKPSSVPTKPSSVSTEPSSMLTEPPSVPMPSNTVSILSASSAQSPSACVAPTFVPTSPLPHLVAFSSIPALSSSSPISSSSLPMPPPSSPTPPPSSPTPSPSSPTPPPSSPTPPPSSPTPPPSSPMPPPSSPTPPPSSPTPPPSSPTPPPSSPTPPPSSPTPPPSSLTPPLSSPTPPPSSPTPPPSSPTPPPSSSMPPPSSPTPPPSSPASSPTSPIPAPASPTPPLASHTAPPASPTAPPRSPTPPPSSSPFASPTSSPTSPTSPPASPTPPPPASPTPPPPTSSTPPPASHTPPLVPSSAIRSLPLHSAPPSAHSPHAFPLRQTSVSPLSATIPFSSPVSTSLVSVSVPCSVDIPPIVRTVSSPPHTLTPVHTPPHSVHLTPVHTPPPSVHSSTSVHTQSLSVRTSLVHTAPCISTKHPSVSSTPPPACTSYSTRTQPSPVSIPKMVGKEGSLSENMYFRCTCSECYAKHLLVLSGYGPAQQGGPPVPLLFHNPPIEIDTDKLKLIEKLKYDEEELMRRVEEILGKDKLVEILDSRCRPELPPKKRLLHTPTSASMSPLIGFTSSPIRTPLPASTPPPASGSSPLSVPCPPLSPCRSSSGTTPPLSLPISSASLPLRSLHTASPISYSKPSLPSPRSPVISTLHAPVQSRRSSDLIHSRSSMASPPPRTCSSPQSAHAHAPSPLVRTSFTPPQILTSIDVASSAGVSSTIASSSVPALAHHHHNHPPHSSPPPPPRSPFSSSSPSHFSSAHSLPVVTGSVFSDTCSQSVRPLSANISVATRSSPTIACVDADVSVTVASPIRASSPVPPILCPSLLLAQPSSLDQLPTTTTQAVDFPSKLTVVPTESLTAQHLRKRKYPCVSSPAELIVASAIPCFSSPVVVPNDERLVDVGAEVEVEVEEEAEAEVEADTLTSQVMDSSPQNVLISTNSVLTVKQEIGDCSTEEKVSCDSVGEHLLLTTLEVCPKEDTVIEPDMCIKEEIYPEDQYNAMDTEIVSLTQARDTVIATGSCDSIRPSSSGIERKCSVTSQICKAEVQGNEAIASCSNKQEKVYRDEVSQRLVRDVVLVSNQISKTTENEPVVFCDSSVQNIPLSEEGCPPVSNEDMCTGPMDVDIDPMVVTQEQPVFTKTNDEFFFHLMNDGVLFGCHSGFGMTFDQSQQDDPDSSAVVYSNFAQFGPGTVGTVDAVLNDGGDIIMEDDGIVNGEVVSDASDDDNNNDDDDDEDDNNKSYSSNYSGYHVRRPTAGKRPNPVLSYVSNDVSDTSPNSSVENAVYRASSSSSSRSLCSRANDSQSGRERLNYPPDCPKTSVMGSLGIPLNSAPKQGRCFTSMEPLQSGSFESREDSSAEDLPSKVIVKNSSRSAVRAGVSSITGRTAEVKLTKTSSESVRGGFTDAVLAHKADGQQVQEPTKPAQRGMLLDTTGSRGKMVRPYVDTMYRGIPVQPPAAPTSIPYPAIANSMAIGKGAPPPENSYFRCTCPECYANHLLFLSGYRPVQPGGPPLPLSFHNPNVETDTDKLESAEMFKSEDEELLRRIEDALAKDKLDDILDSRQIRKGLDSSLPPKKRLKAIAAISNLISNSTDKWESPKEDSFPSYPTKPMISIAELDFTERLFSKHVQRPIKTVMSNNPQQYVPYGYFQQFQHGRDMSKMQNVISQYQQYGPGTSPVVNVPHTNPGKEIPVYSCCSTNVSQVITCEKAMKYQQPSQRDYSTTKDRVVAPAPENTNTIKMEMPSNNQNPTANSWEYSGRQFKTPAQLKELPALNYYVGMPVIKCDGSRADSNVLPNTEMYVPKLNSVEEVKFGYSQYNKPHALDLSVEETQNMRSQKNRRRKSILSAENNMRSRTPKRNSRNQAVNQNANPTDNYFLPEKRMHRKHVPR